jgi:PAS domain S-box-containing protein
MAPAEWEGLDMIAKYRMELEQANKADVVRRLIAEYEDEVAEFMEYGPRATGQQADSILKLRKRPEAVCIYTAQGRIVHANEQLLHITGYDVHELIGLNLSTLFVNSRDIESLKEEIEYKGYLIDYRIKLLKKDGNMITCYISATIRWYNDENVPINQPLIKAWIRPEKQ